MLLSALVWVSYGFYCVFGALCLATGLYIVAEFVEEHTKLTRRILRWVIICVFALRILLWITERFSFVNTLAGELALGCYYTLIQKNFPFIEFKNPVFLAAVGLSILDHFLWFRYFHVYPEFLFPEILAYFVICVWLVPFGVFVSLSSNDNMLPGLSLGNVPASSYGTAPQWQQQAGGNGDLDAANKPRHIRTVNRLLALFNFLRKKRQEILPSSVLNVKAL